MSESIVFQVETSRILEILSKEIYDSPLALLRENLQNAYDAVRMRFAPSGSLEGGGRIDINVNSNSITITDNGVGMSEEVLRENYWKAGSSGKHSDTAKKAGVIGTFGIGAMANFGVCSRLTVETRALGGTKVLRSVADRGSLKIAESCISLESIESSREVGTTVTAILDSEHHVTESQAKQYLEPYVAYVPVPIYLNGSCISCVAFDSHVSSGGRTFTEIGAKDLKDNFCAALFSVHIDPNGQVLVKVTKITLGGATVDGTVALIQAGGTLMGFRSYFGLAPIPATGYFQFGGLANLSFLQPTAGREALSRESITQMSRIVNLAEKAACELIANSTAADRNNAFLNWIVANRRFDLASRVTIRVLPDNQDWQLQDITSKKGARNIHYFTGTDLQTIGAFANEVSILLHVAQGNPRRNVQLHYVQTILGITQVPNAAHVIQMFKGSELTAAEATIALRIGSILRDDYLIPEVEVVLSEISHRVTVLPEKVGDTLRIHIDRTSALLLPLLQVYEKSYQLLTPFTKDFVRIHVFPRIESFVPSSTRGGVEALRKVLQRNRELYRYEESELGDLSALLGEYLSGSASFAQMLTSIRSTVRAQGQRVSVDQVGSIESVVPDVVASPVTPGPQDSHEFGPIPPIIRSDVSSDLKILTTSERHAQLHNFVMFLGLSDRLVRTEGEFFRAPHTTRILWGGHRVIYIFTEATGRLSLYYDIELKNPLDESMAGGGMFATTTLITKKRIFVPVPDSLVSEFKPESGPKEFFVRFDLLTADEG